ncbi:PREDICTED: protein unc-50 homolog [Trachymyrmex cornetzi]|uniref:Protein unc-50 like protein n=1 Tax=Trachymyrmex cornetzi TaxID=471704 RepID=A0A151J4C6_9HYME|nr:PREDICTED: protein unc-50 homolog [Trachymyrmex cornetzi]KYN17491.1 Protein unc-50 like protein [Trachymyrmex cornetzi]
MKYSTSPPTSRCHSPVPTEFSSSLPMPIVYRHNCMGAATKSYKYLRKLLKFEQMDFEFAMWQMVYLFVAPQKVYRNFQNRKQTKSHFARDDPAFLVLVMGCFCISTIGLGLMLNLRIFQFTKLLLYMMFIDYLAVGLLIATIFWFITNRYLRIDRTQDVEWGYAFDIHLNAVFPPLVILHILQLFLYNGLINNDTFWGRFIGNTFWFISIGYYIYITFLGYASIEILHKTHLILSTLPIMLLTYITTLCAGINISYLVIEFYRYRAL